MFVRPPPNPVNQDKLPSSTPYILLLHLKSMRCLHKLIRQMSAKKVPELKGPNSSTPPQASATAAKVAAEGPAAAALAAAAHPAAQ